MELNTMDDIPFTPDEDFDELQIGDTTVTIVGYVDKIMDAAPVGARKHMLYKFIINNNGSKRVEVLIWNQLIDKFKNEIAINKILILEFLKCKASFTPSYKSERNTIPFQLNLQKHSQIECLGNFNIVPVGFNTLSSHVGKTVQVTGYMKSRFCLVESGNVSYGCGSITDGVSKITVEVSSFTGSDIKRGENITAIGKVLMKGTLTLICRDIGKISVNRDVAPMSLASLLRGVKSPKRKLDEVDS